MGNLWSKAKGWIGKNVVLVGLVAWLSWLSDAVDKFQSASEKVNWILHWSWGHGLITSAIVVLLVLNERRINRQEYVTAQTQGDLALRVAQNQVREFREEMRPTLELVDYLADIGTYKTRHTALTRLLEMNYFDPNQLAASAQQRMVDLYRQIPWMNEYSAELAAAREIGLKRRNILPESVPSTAEEIELRSQIDMTNVRDYMQRLQQTFEGRSQWPISKLRKST